MTTAAVIAVMVVLVMMGGWVGGDMRNVVWVIGVPAFVPVPVPVVVMMGAVLVLISSLVQMGVRIRWRCVMALPSRAHGLELRKEQPNADQGDEAPA